MRKETKELLENRLKYVDDKIVDREDNVRGSFYMMAVGCAGIISGVLCKSESSIISGAIVVFGSLGFQAMNSMFLNSLMLEKDGLEYGLSHPESVHEHYVDDFQKVKKRRGGKHFKK